MESAVKLTRLTPVGGEHYKPMLPALRVLSEPPPSAARNNSGVQIASPFVGLGPYTEADARFFFGRDRDVKVCLDRLERDRLVVLVGDHGSGRTSLVRAGIPAAARLRLSSAAHGELSVLHLDLGTSPQAPLDALLEQLERWADHAPSRSDADEEADSSRVSNGHLRALVLGSETGLCEAATRLGGGQRPLLVVVDGLEELAVERPTAGSDASASQQLLSLLVTAAARRETLIYVVLTTTTQGLGWAQRQLDDRELLSQSTWFLRAPSKADLVRIISGPAALNGVEPDAALTQRILADLKKTRAPLGRLSHALERTWDAWRKQDGQRTEAPSLTHYESVGGLEHAFEQHAEALFDAQTNDEREATGIVLARLLRQDTSAQPAGSELASDPSTADTPIVRELRYDSALDAALRSAAINDPRSCFESALAAWEQMGLVVRIAEGKSDAPASSSKSQRRVRLVLTTAARAWPRLGLWVHAERAQQAQYRRWLRLAEPNTSGEAQVVLQGELLRQAALFWNQYATGADAEAKDETQREGSANADPVGHMIQTSQVFAQRQEETQSALARARSDRRHADVVAQKARRRRDASVLALAVVGVALCGALFSHWKLGVAHEALQLTNNQTSEQKRALDEQHAQAQLENQRQGQQIEQITLERQQVAASLAAAETDRAQQRLAIAGLETEKAEFEKNIGILRRHSLKQDELIASKAAEIDALRAQSQALGGEVSSAEARARELSLGKAALGIELQQCQAQKAAALQEVNTARAELARQQSAQVSQPTGLQGATAPRAKQ